MDYLFFQNKYFGQLLSIRCVSTHRSLGVQFPLSFFLTLLSKRIFIGISPLTRSPLCAHILIMAALSLSRSVTWWLVRAGEIFAGTQPTAALRNPACAASLCLSEAVHFVKMASGSWTPGAETEQCFMMSMANNLIWFWGPVQCHCLISKSYRFSQKSSFL